MALEELLLCYPGYPGVKVILSGHNAGAGAGSRSLVAMNARKWPLVIRSLRHREYSHWRVLTETGAQTGLESGVHS